MIRNPPHAFGVDDIALPLVSVPNPVPRAGHFNRALPGIFSQAPKGETGRINWANLSFTTPRTEFTQPYQPLARPVLKTLPTRLLL